MAKTPTKYIFVTGGVLSGLGKGITAASIGTVLKSRGLKVNIQKLDPYLNTDAGTLNPAEHGEVFVTADGAETDLDLGHYERFLEQELTQTSSVMSGRVLAKVIDDERAGKYLGKTVQIIPHVTGAIQDYIEKAGAGFDVHIVELGGTIGDYEGLAFVEAIREFKHRVGAKNVINVHLVYLPYLEASKELKTKPAQNAVRNLRSLGISPDVLIARSDHPVSENLIEKLSLYSDVEPAGILPLPTVDSVYKVPLVVEEGKMGDYIVDKLELKATKPNLTEWEKLTKIVTDKKLPNVSVAVVAKYMDHEDTYMSVFEALKAAGWANKLQVSINWVSAEQLEKNKADVEEVLGGYDGIVVPGGFGYRGIEGKILAATYALQNNVPYLGLCLGMQVAVIALGRQVLGSDVNSTEFYSNTEHPVISLMAEQKEIANMGGTMRLGNYKCVLKKGTLARKLYGKASVDERHRHRFEFNNKYREIMQQNGMVLSGLSPDEKLVELIEMNHHPFFIASQFHPEYKSRPNTPHPLFNGFIKAAKTKQKSLAKRQKSKTKIENS
ncbi:MAG: CTP synthase [Candidatus Saccharimonadales bacterium]